jgi:hypothetical protein
VGEHEGLQRGVRELDVVDVEPPVDLGELGQVRDGQQGLLGADEEDLVGEEHGGVDARGRGEHRLLRADLDLGDRPGHREDRVVLVGPDQLAVVLVREEQHLHVHQVDLDLQDPGLDVLDDEGDEDLLEQRHLGVQPVGLVGGDVY